MIKIKSKKEEFELFDKLSNEWWNDRGKFRVLHEIRPLRIEYILNQFDKRDVNNIDVLDIGCGGGLICESLYNLGANVTGLDFSPNNIRVAKKHAKLKELNINYVCKDIEKVDLNKKFDLIILFEILEHLDNWQSLVNKIKKNLKKNGKIIISTINRNFISKYLAINLAENILKWIPKGTHDYNKFITPEEIKLVCEKIGFIPENYTGMIFNPIDTTWKLSKNTMINYFCTLKSN